MGHEFCAGVLEAGPATDGPPPGTTVVSVPALLSSNGVHRLTYNNDYPCGYAQQMLLSAPLVLPVPNGLHPHLAALTEPLAVGLHAVAKSGVQPHETAVVSAAGRSALPSLRRYEPLESKPLPTATSQHAAANSRFVWARHKPSTPQPNQRSISGGAPPMRTAH